MIYMFDAQKFSRFDIIQLLQQQVKVVIPSLSGNKELINILKSILLKRQAIENVGFEGEGKLITIDFDPEQLPKHKVLELLDNVLANFPKTNQRINKTEACHAEKQQFIFTVEGMSCTSCTLFLEMLLLREKGVQDVKIDFDTKKGIVKSSISAAKIFKIIEDNGFQAY